MKICYSEDLHMSKENTQILLRVNEIIEEYRQQGYVLTLRQLYYQLVSKNLIRNDDREYKKLGSLLVRGRMAGIVDWDVIEDRVRVPDEPPGWASTSSILRAVASQYRKDRMLGQDQYIEVWVEKDALSGVLKPVTHKYGVTLMVNRGYSSASAMHDAYQRFEEAWQEGKSVTILYLGDHDPSGLDMINDIKKRISTFADVPYENLEAREEFFVEHIAITGPQIRRYNPPPNPAKLSDSRSKWYIERYGHTSWEVDAIPPKVLHELVVQEIEERIDKEQYQQILEEEDKDRERLRVLAEEEEVRK